MSRKSVTTSTSRVDTRFRKGQSGNPRGRPKSRKIPDPKGSAFDIIIARSLTITEGGKARQVTVEEALQHKTYQQAIAGNRMARREVLKMIAKREKALANELGKHLTVTQLIEPVDPKNAYEALCLLDIAIEDPSWTEPKRETRLLLTSWAVQAAFNRRGLRSLRPRDIREIKRCTFDADTLVWPDRLLHDAG